MNVVKSKEEFECLMRERQERLGEGNGQRLIPIRCTPDGEPDGDKARRMMCEAQKFVLGDESLYMVCAAVERYDPAICNGRYKRLAEIAGIEPGGTYFDIVITVQSFDTIINGKLYDKLIYEEVVETSDGPSYAFPRSGRFCAFPGGCP